MLPYFLLLIAQKASASVVNRDLLKIQEWAYQWKMPFNPDRAKQAHKVIFFRKTNKIVHPPLYFNNATFKLTDTQKHLGLQLDSKLSFSKYSNNKISKVIKGTGFLHMLQPILPRRSLNK